MAEGFENLEKTSYASYLLQSISVLSMELI